MKRFIGISATFLIVTAFVLLVIGCGGSKKDATGPDSDTLSKDEQYETLDQFVNMDFESDDALFDINDIVADQSSSLYFDGVDSSDVVGGAMMSPALSALGKQGALQADTLILDYNPQSGWWSISYEAHDDLFGINIDLLDSVRFETLDGTPQFDPDASTYRVVQRGGLSMEWAMSGQDGSFSMAMSTDVDLNVTGLNASVVTVAGGSSGNFDFDMSNADTTVALNFAFTAANHNVTIPGPNPGMDACPSGGSASANFSVDIDVQEGTTHNAASGAWVADVLFLGDGQATVTVESGDFTHTATGDICQ